ncbi:hypothetical protein M9Y10_018284 [Tritrichomonas musculus]|uniref:Protein kinase domain-containing protein n=1 Tax=Tritrichomonas musculus TaxID=1915356 RepID=A0ABR2HP61_9EUKA
MFLCGQNGDFRLGGSLNPISNKPKDIEKPIKSSLEVSSLLSFSAFHHSVWITQKGEAFAVGSNSNGEISSTLKKEAFRTDTRINLKYEKGQPCNFISAVTGGYYTLYLVSGETSSDSPQLIYAHSNEKTTFLNIGKRSPVSLFGGCVISAVIDTEGSVIIITRSVFKSPASELEALNLPDNEKAVKAACCNKSVIVLSESGNVFECSLKKEESMSFVKVSELSNIKEISGTYEHFFAITNDGRVFGRGTNDNCRLGLPNNKDNLDKFEYIESLNKCNIVEAFAGVNDSLFRTSDGKVIGCGSNFANQLMLEKEIKNNISLPEESMISSNATFCIVGSCISVAFVGVQPPPNTPNRIKKPYSLPEVMPPETDSKKEISEHESKDKETVSLKAENSALKAENSTLKEENSSLKDQNLSLKEECLSLQEKLDELQKRIKEIEAENDKLKLKLKERDADKDKVTDEKKSDESQEACSLEIFDPRVVDKMKKIKLLGRGTTSEVFEVTRGKTFALKVYDADIVKEKNFDDEDEEKFVVSFKNMKNLIREMESLNALDHANIVKAFGISFGDAKHPPAILLEYCASNLKEKIKELTNSERICAIVDISSAMKTVHSVGIIHRDLKLENILLDENNKIKVSDFGLCTLVCFESLTTSRTQMIGPSLYMAPELINEEVDYDEKVDVYSFGVLVYLILNKGEFPKVNFIDVGSGRKAKIPESFTEFSRNLINKCWSFNASERPSFAEICEMLKGNESKLI